MGRGSSSIGGGFGGGSFSGPRGSSSIGSRNHNSTHVHISYVPLWLGTSRAYYSDGTRKQYKKTRNKVATIIVSIILFAAAIGLFLGAYFTSFDYKYEEIHGKVVTIDIRGDYIYTEYTYIIDGEQYTEYSQVGWTELPNDIDITDAAEKYYGKDYLLYYNKKAPNEIMEVEAREDIDTPSVAFVIIGVLMTIFGLCVAIGGINKYTLVEQPKPATAEGDNTATDKKGQKVVCKYCGSSVNSDNDRCPNCGAGLY